MNGTTPIAAARASGAPLHPGDASASAWRAPLAAAIAIVELGLDLGRRLVLRPRQRAGPGAGHQRGADHRRPQLRHHARHLHRGLPGRGGPVAVPDDRPRRHRHRARGAGLRRAARRRCPPSDVPPPVQAESTNGNQSLTDSITPQSSPDGLGVGNESASATTQPTSDSTTTRGQHLACPAGCSPSTALTHDAHASIDSGNTRTATATADIGQLSLANGAVVLGGLHWAATQQSGAAPPRRPAPSPSARSPWPGVPVDLSPARARRPRPCSTSSTRRCRRSGSTSSGRPSPRCRDGTVVISPLRRHRQQRARPGGDRGQPEHRPARARRRGQRPAERQLQLRRRDPGGRHRHRASSPGGGNLNVSLGGARR